MDVEEAVAEVFEPHCTVRDCGKAAADGDAAGARL